MGRKRKNPEQVLIGDDKAALGLKNMLMHDPNDKIKGYGLGTDGAEEVRFYLQQMKKRTTLPMQYMIVEGLRFAIDNKPEFKKFAPEIKKAWEEELDRADAQRLQTVTEKI